MLVFAFINLNGQSHKIDSLRIQLSKSNNDSTSSNLLIEIGKAFEMVNPDSSIVFYNNALLIANKNNDEKIQAIAKRHIGNWHIDKREYDLALDNLHQALKIALGIDNKFEIGRIYNSIGLVYNNLNVFDKAIEYSNMAVDIAAEVNDSITLSYSYNNIGLAYYNRSIYDEALKYFLLSAKIDELNGDIKGLGQGYINVGLIHYTLGNTDQAIYYYEQSIKIAEELGEVIDISIGYNNIAIIYKQLEQYDKALVYLEKALAIDKGLGDKGGMAICYINIGDVYLKIGDFNRARRYFMQSLKIWDEIHDDSGTATVLYYLADLNISLAKKESHNVEVRDSLLYAAIEYSEKSLEIGKRRDYLPAQNSAAESLKTIYALLGNYEKAFEYLEIYVSTKEKIINEEKIRSITDSELKWEAERRQLQIEKLETEREIDKLELIRKKQETKQQRAVIIMVSAGLLIISVLLFVLQNRLLYTKKQNQVIDLQKKVLEDNYVRLNEKTEEIQAQNEEIEAQNYEIQAQRDVAIQQKEFIERQNQAITNSINYAKRIQQALLPDLSLLDEKYNGLDSITDSFVLFQPKEIVSGDFYWANRINNHLIIAVADCTGHGVPGGFMSMLGISFLNEIVNKQENYIANEILNQLRDIVNITLTQAGRKDEDDNPILDGINIVIAVIDIEKMELQYSGSFNPLYLVRNNTLSILKTDRTTIGVFVKNKGSFTNYNIKLEKGDTFYMFSDGYIDQFDESGSQRYKYSRFKNLLLSIQNESLQKQKEILYSTFEKWKGNNDQIDDITVLGFRI